MALQNLMGGVATDDSLIMLRRLCDLLESNSIVDVGGRQRVAVETMPSVTVGSSGAVSNVAQLAGYDHRQFIDMARIAYSTGLRSQLVFS